MSRTKDVAWLRVPYPDVKSGLAKQSHMYICTDGGKSQYVKCSSLKPKHKVMDLLPKHHLIEAANAERNPFTKKTVIDCDKWFVFDPDVEIAEAALTKNRRDISDDLFLELLEKLNHDNLESLRYTYEQLKSLNPTFIYRKAK